MPLNFSFILISLIGQNIASNSDECNDSCDGKRRRRKEEETRPGDLVMPDPIG